MTTNFIKKIALAALLLPVAPALHAQTYTSGDITVASMVFANHDSTWCHSTCAVMYDITIDHSFLNDSVRVIDTVSGAVTFTAGNTSGVTPWHVSMPAFVNLFNNTVTDDQLFGTTAYFMMHPTKVISGPDTVGPIHDVFPLFVPDPCVYDTVSGTVYIDNNADCINNLGDDALGGMQINNVSNLSSPSVSTNSRYAFSGTSGYYNMTVQRSWMTSYTISLPPAYYFIYPLTPCFSGAYSLTTLPYAHLDFSLQCSDSVDVMSYSGYPPAIKWGRTFYMEPYVSNTGCNPASGTLTLVKDSRVIYDASLSTVPATSVSGDTLRWAYTNLTNVTAGGYWNSLLSSINLYPDTSAHVGDTLCFHIYSDIPSTDIDHSNNDQTICLPVVYSYDPNIKEVSPKGDGTAGNIPATTPRLTYTLHFQNTGTAPATNVNVVDTLDANVDPTTLRILGSSHRMSPEWLAPNVVRFNFNYINLPDSFSNEAASHGSVSFSIKPRPSLAVGTQLKNKGYIYFDANPAVITNTALNTISGSLQAGPAITASAAVSIYPNPAQSVIHIDGAQAGTVSVTDMNGMVIINRTISAGRNAVDISGLAAGIYIIRTISNDQVTVTKFTKQ